MHLRYIFVHNLYRINKTVKMFWWNNRQDKCVACAINTGNITTQCIMPILHTTYAIQNVSFHELNYFFHADIGQNFVKRSTIDIESIQKHAAKDARDAAERRHVKELKAALQRQQTEMEDDKLRCLKNQKLVSLECDFSLKLHQLCPIIVL